jgi:hypothetical protein
MDFHTNMEMVGRRFAYRADYTVIFYVAIGDVYTIKQTTRGNREESLDYYNKLTSGNPWS